MNCITNEQNFPTKLHNIKEEFTPIWWCERIDTEIFGIVASWGENNEWHWGRFAINKRLCGLGIGKKFGMSTLN